MQFFFQFPKRLSPPKVPRYLVLTQFCYTFLDRRTCGFLLPHLKKGSLSWKSNGLVLHSGWESHVEYSNWWVGWLNFWLGGTSFGSKEFQIIKKFIWCTCIWNSAKIKKETKLSYTWVSPKIHNSSSSQLSHALNSEWQQSSGQCSAPTLVLICLLCTLW